MARGCAVFSNGSKARPRAKGCGWLPQRRKRIVRSSAWSRRRRGGRAKRSESRLQPASAGGASESFQRFGLTAAQPAKAGTSNHLLPRTGTVQVADNLARFVRPGVTEEYRVSMDGLRQDFIIEQRPLPTGQAGVGAGTLRVELVVAGAKVEPLADGARLLLENCGRKIAYSRLRVTDVTGKELTARI